MRQTKQLWARDFRFIAPTRVFTQPIVEFRVQTDLL